MKKSDKDRLFTVTVKRHADKQPEVYLIHALDQEEAKRRGAWYARAQPEQVIQVSAAG